MFVFSFSACGQSEVLSSGSYSTQIEKIAAGSTCASYSWKGRGQAPIGYVKGMALTFGRSMCRYWSTGAAPALIMMEGDTHSSAYDAITYYRKTFKSMKIPVVSSDFNTMRAVYTLAMGLGMRESSGNYCEGWDKSAGSHRPSSAGEAGPFQTSYDSIGAADELTYLYSEYLGSTNRCMTDIWKEGVSCVQQDPLGNGAGAAYQKFTKACPAFAAEYAMTLLRRLRAHWGPIIRKEAEVKGACYNMLAQVQSIVQNDPAGACAELL